MLTGAGDGAPLGPFVDRRDALWVTPIQKPVSRREKMYLIKSSPPA